MLAMISALATECRGRHATTNNLAQRRQVRFDAEQRLRATFGHAKPGHHLIENQDRARVAALSRSVSRNPATGGTMFMLPATGSTMTQAI